MFADLVAFLERLTEIDCDGIRAVRKGAALTLVGALFAVLAFSLLVLHVQTWPARFSDLSDAGGALLPNVILVSFGLMSLYGAFGGVMMIHHGRKTR